MDILLDPKIMTFVCFGLWLMCTVSIMVLQVFKPEPVHGKIHPVRNFRHHLLIFGIMVWSAMWCFRTMY
jgi:hypothetical protein